MMFSWVKNLFRPTYTQSELNQMDKLELERIGRKWGIELDRRFVKSKLIKQLQKKMNS